MNDVQTKSPAVVMEMAQVTVASARDMHVSALKNVNWSVAEGEYWAVAGLQGSGKSDLMMTAGGLMPPKSGTYRLFGEMMPIFEDERLATRLRLGLVFDDGRLLSHMTVAENVSLPLRYHRDLTPEAANEKTAEILEMTELLPWANSAPGTMAWRWQKRVGLARALALKPELLLVDNPLGGLDPSHALWWLNFLDELSAGHGFMGGHPMTLVVTVDNLQQLKDRARQFALVRHGEFVPLGTREQAAKSNDGLAKEFLAGAVNI